MTSARTTAFALWAGALVLYLSGLWFEPLRDWEESTYARIAHEMAAAGWQGWLHPTLWGAPYLNKPTFLFGLMAISFDLIGESAFAARLPAALLTSATVPLLYLLALELTGRRDRALWVGLVHLLLLPVLRHGRLAMLDGVATLGLVAALLCLLWAERQQLWGLVAGLAFAMVALTKGLLVLPFLLIALAFSALSRRGQLRWQVWGLVALGCLPALAWFGAQWQFYGQTYTDKGLIDQGFARLWTAVEGNRGSIVYYLLELLKTAWPWALFLPAALWLVWRERAQTWARLVLIWLGGFSVLLMVMPTKLPWYVYPVYPALSLALGCVIADARAGVLAGRGATLFRIGIWGLPLLAFAGLAGAVWMAVPHPVLAASLSVAGIGLALSFMRLYIGNSRGLQVMATTSFAALWLFTLSGQTVWELNEDYPVPPVALMIRINLPPDAPLSTTHSHARPALNYLAGRYVTPRPVAEMLDDRVGSLWLARPSDIEGFERRFDVLGRAEGWLLLRHHP